jgi:hypothetical protein
MANSSVQILENIQNACEITAAKNTHMELRQCEHTPEMEASCRNSQGMMTGSRGYITKVHRSVAIEFVKGNKDLEDFTQGILNKQKDENRGQYLCATVYYKYTDDENHKWPDLEMVPESNQINSMAAFHPGFRTQLLADLDMKNPEDKAVFDKFPEIPSALQAMYSLIERVDHKHNVIGKLENAKTFLSPQRFKEEECKTLQPEDTASFQDNLNKVPKEVKDTYMGLPDKKGESNTERFTRAVVKLFELAVASQVARQVKADEAYQLQKAQEKLDEAKYWAFVKEEFSAVCKASPADENTILKVMQNAESAKQFQKWLKLYEFDGGDMVRHLFEQQGEEDKPSSSSD